MTDIIDRPRYVQQIVPHIDTPNIKVLTGVRRCGKSTILKLVEERIRARHQEANFVCLNMESADALSIRTPEDLLNKFSHLAPSKDERTYFFLDELQQVPGWEDAINALRVNWNCDIYLTGSNSRMLSGDLATNLAGRYVEFRIQPLSFAEFVDLYGSSKSESPTDLFQKYVRHGGLPGLKYFNFQPEPIAQYMSTLYDSTVLKDVVEHNAIRDVNLFNRVTRYAFANIGTTFSANSVAKFLKQEKRTISTDTVLNYLEYCTQAFLLDQAPRFDVKGKAAMLSREKYYCADHGYRIALGLSNEAEIERVLENIVYQEMRSRGFEVSVGTVKKKEVDFIAQKGSETIYLQVSYLLASPDTIEREFGSLKAVSDNFPKYVLSMDNFDLSRDGIEHKNIVDFLLKI